MPSEGGRPGLPLWGGAITAKPGSVACPAQRVAGPCSYNPCGSQKLRVPKAHHKSKKNATAAYFNQQAVDGCEKSNHKPGGGRGLDGDSEMCKLRFRPWRRCPTRWK